MKPAQLTLCGDGPLFDSYKEPSYMTEPNAEMTAALQAFADRNGRDWKDKLSCLWANGRDYYEPEGNALHEVRNNLGPSWLWDECKIKPTPPRRYAINAGAC